MWRVNAVSTCTPSGCYETKRLGFGILRFHMNMQLTNRRNRKLVSSVLQMGQEEGRHSEAMREKPID